MSVPSSPKPPRPVRNVPSSFPMTKPPPRPARTPDATPHSPPPRPLPTPPVSPPSTTDFPIIPIDPEPQLALPRGLPVGLRPAFDPGEAFDVLSTSPPSSPITRICVSPPPPSSSSPPPSSPSPTPTPSSSTQSLELATPPPTPPLPPLGYPSTSSSSSASSGSPYPSSSSPFLSSSTPPITRSLSSEHNDSSTPSPITSSSSSSSSSSSTPSTPTATTAPTAFGVQFDDTDANEVDPRHQRSLSFAESASCSSEEGELTSTLFIHGRTGEWLLEQGSGTIDYRLTSSSSMFLIDEDRYTHYYAHYFYERPHRVYMAYDISDVPVVVVLQKLSAEQKQDNLDIPFLRALIVTSFPIADKNQLWYWTMIPSVFSEKKLKKHILANLPVQLRLATDIKEITDPSFPASFLEFESQVKGSQNSYKFGLVYCEQDQLTEREMYRNVAHSEEFDEFLAMLGDRVDLHHYPGFTGGLPTTYAGQQMLTTKAWNVDCVFHVSTLLPFDPEHDPDMVQRKRHIANDVAVIVYNNGTHPINPTMFISQFVHVILVVQVDRATTKETGITHYRIAMASKYGCHSLIPAIPDPPVFPCGERFRLFLLSKLVNSERTAMYLPNFQSRVSRTFNFNIQELRNKYLPKRPKQLKSSAHASVDSPLIADSAQKEMVKRQMKEKKRNKKSVKIDPVQLSSSPSSGIAGGPASPRHSASPPHSPRPRVSPIEPQDRDSPTRIESTSRLSQVIRRSTPMFATSHSFSSLPDRE